MALKCVVLTHNGQVDTDGPGLRCFKVHSTTVKTIIAFTDVKDFESSFFGPRAGIKYNPIMSKYICVHPMTTGTDTRYTGNVNSTPRIYKIRRKLGPYHDWY